jgi:hypothetical protein
MFKVMFSILIAGSVVCGATQFPFHIGMGSNASTVGKISGYSNVQRGLWTGYWKPKNFTVSVQEETGSPVEQMNAWPNPSSGIFNIEHEGNVKVFSSHGSLVFEGTINGVLNIEQLPSGVYTVNTEFNKTVRIVKR